MKCKNCGHLIEDTVQYWKDNYNQYYFHKRSPRCYKYLGREVERMRHVKSCFCGCKKPEPEKKGGKS